MKIARFEDNGNIRLGVVDGDTMIDVGSADPSLPTDVGEAIALGKLDHIESLASAAPRLGLGPLLLKAPIAQPPEFLAIGLNYQAHVEETGQGDSPVPIVFNKQVTCIAGPTDPVEIPTAAPNMVDYEGELGVVIGQRCRGVTASEAPQVVAGYLVVNDVTVRDWQGASPTMTMGKSWDTHGPTGPWLVTADEVPDPHDLRIRTWVDNDLRQDASTAQMINNCWELIAHLSTAFTLLPGTIIATGTPAGVGFAMKPPQFLAPGSSVRIEIDGVGVIENLLVAQPVGD